MSAKIKTIEPNTCPRCGNSDDLHGGAVDVSGMFATQEVTCMACDEQFTDVYRLSHAEIDGDTVATYEAPSET